MSAKPIPVIVAETWEDEIVEFFAGGNGGVLTTDIKVSDYRVEAKSVNEGGYYWDKNGEERFIMIKSEMTF